MRDVSRFITENTKAEKTECDYKIAKFEAVL